MTDTAEKDAPVDVGSLWQRKPPGSETVRIERVWDYRDEGLSVRAHSTTGGRPLVAPVAYLTEHYTLVAPPIEGDA